MDINQIENNIEALLNSFTEESFIYGLLSAYGLPNAAVTRLRNGEYNLSKDKNQILWKKRVCYQIQKTGDLHATIDELKKSPAVTKQHPRFLIVTDFNTLLAIDTDNSDTLDIPLKDLSRHFDFFLPWAGMEKSQLQRENPADIKAAERMGRLYDLILEENPIENEAQRHSLNVFFTRLLFCYFAEDTGIFPSGIFVNGIASHTSEDGSDLQSYLSKVFEILNQQDRNKCPAFLAEYPYVNGGLFATSSPVPKFNGKSRKILIECGALNWKAINPDIFGSMMQAVVHTDERSGKGMHYTSVVNIMKVIEPLFLNDLREELENAGENKQKLQKLLDRIYNIRIFDPACGSGNFLIITYKELCKLEIEIFKRLNPHGQKSFHFLNKLKINQFYGIEIDDFAHETAKLSLWLAEHQMNLAFREIFGDARPTLPLQEGGNIVCGNATRINWSEVCPKQADVEVYIVGNPPYLGAKMLDADQRNDAEAVLGQIAGYGILDYICCWMLKASEFSKGYSAKFAFVATNSICQGEQVAVLWPSILGDSLEIFFAHQGFKWANNARENAGVICIVIGVRNKTKAGKWIYTSKNRKAVERINPYLVEASSIYVTKRGMPISQVPEMRIGNKPIDGGFYLFTSEEKEEFIRLEPKSSPYFYRWFGSREFLQGVTRWCLLVSRIPKLELELMPRVKERIEKVRAFRETSPSKPTRAIASVPERFHVETFPKDRYLVVPKVSSERRDYIPLGYLSASDIASDLLNVIEEPSIYIFAVLSSKMHMTWVRAVAGRLKTDFRYSSQLCYNTFPFPSVNSSQLNELENYALAVLDIREEYSERTYAELYDPDGMPGGLKAAHGNLDQLVDSLYRRNGFEDDSERLECLLNLYETSISTNCQSPQGALNYA